MWNCARRASSAATPVRQELQRDRLVEREVVGAVHLAHAAASEQRDEAVAAGDDRAGREPIATAAGVRDVTRRDGDAAGRSRIRSVRPVRSSAAGRVGHVREILLEEE